MSKTYQSINEKIAAGKAVVLTAEEVIAYVDRKGLEAGAKEVDVVTTATFGPMCSSGCFLNFGHSKPKMRITEAWINDVQAYCGIAAVDVYLGATQLRHNDPANMYHPGEFRYGGGHVIEDLVSGRPVRVVPKGAAQTWSGSGRARPSRLSALRRMVFAFCRSFFVEA